MSDSSDFESDFEDDESSKSESGENKENSESGDMKNLQFSSEMPTTSSTVASSEPGKSESEASNDDKGNRKYGSNKELLKRQKIQRENLNESDSLSGGFSSDFESESKTDNKNGGVDKMINNKVEDIIVKNDADNKENIQINDDDVGKEDDQILSDDENINRINANEIENNQIHNNDVNINKNGDVKAEIHDEKSESSSSSSSSGPKIVDGNESEINEVDDVVNTKLHEDDIVPEKNPDDGTFFTSNTLYMANKDSPRRSVETQSNVFSTEEPKTKRNTARKYNQNQSKLSSPAKSESEKENSNDNQFMDEHMEELRERAMNLENLDDLTNEEFESLLIILNQDRRKYIVSKNFQEGNRLNTAFLHVQKSYEHNKKLRLQRQEYQKYKAQKDEFDRQLKAFDDETKDILNKIDQRNKEALANLEEQHERESNEHYMHWMSEAKIRQYNRASQTLMMNRKQQQLLLDQCRFTEAEAIEQTIAKLEKQEEAIAHKMMQHDYDESLKALNEKQQSEIDFVLQKGKLRKQQAQQRRLVERSTLMNKEKKILAIKEQVSDPEKVWNLAQNQRINEIYKKKDNDHLLPPIKLRQTPLTTRQQGPSTIIKLPPLIMRRPTRRSNFAPEYNQ